MWNSYAAAIRSQLLAGVACVAISASAANAQSAKISLPEQPLADSLAYLSQCTGKNILFEPEGLAGVRAHALAGQMTAEEAVEKLLQGTGLILRSDGNNGLIILRESHITPASQKSNIRVAQATQAPPPALAPSVTSQQVEQVVVTGTRIVRNGYQSPTPLTVINADQLQTNATTDAADYLNELPQFVGSSTPISTANGINNHQGSINALNLRGLGTVRTLVLLNGQRIVGDNDTGVVDVSELPQELIQRVDTVFGGASAVYGSDALTGVVNIILDTKYDGIKGELSGGVTNYGDDRNWKGALTAGTGFAGDRGHIEVSGDAEENRGILGTDPERRSWDSKGNMMMNNPAYGTGPGQSRSVPQYIAESQVGMYNAAPGGLITSGPLMGTMFGPGGSVSQLVYGSTISPPLMSGGDWRATNQADRFAVALFPRTSRQNFFGRVSYNINNNIEVYAQGQWGHSHEISTSVANYFTGSITVTDQNPLIPPAIAASMAAQGITSFKFGTMLADIPGTTPTYDRSVNRELVGADGDFDAFGTSWKWDAHMSYGYSRGTSSAADTLYLPNWNNAIDVVRNSSTGQIVCRSTLTNPDNGCVPFNLFGTGVNSQAAIDYVTGQDSTNPGGHFYHDHLLQVVQGVNLSGEPFSLWAGPVSIATGIEHRKESTRATADPGEAAQEWFITSGTPFGGSFSVTEGYVETLVPLAKDASWADSLDLDLAARATGYSTFGFAATWKAGLNYNIGDLRFRATESHDIREPTMVDLYSAPTTVNYQIADPFVNNQNVNYIGITTGNPKLEPESALSTGLGVVYQPSWLPGFSGSFDYYQIDITKAITTFSATNILNLCYDKVQAACSGVIQTGTDSAGLPILQITAGPENFASEKAKGFDIESTYLLPLNTVVDAWRGNVAFHMLLTHFISDVQNSGVAGTIPQQLVGQNRGGNPPHYKFQGTVNYNLDPMVLGLTVRGISSGTIDNSWITCTTGCPVSTANHITTDQNHIAGAIYFDLNASYFIDQGQIELFFNVKNLLNLNPPVYYPGPNNNSWQTFPANGQDYDILGRVFRVGLRFAM